MVAVVMPALTWTLLRVGGVISGGAGEVVKVPLYSVVCEPESMAEIL